MSSKMPIKNEGKKWASLSDYVGVTHLLSIGDLDGVDLVNWMVACRSRDTHGPRERAEIVKMLAGLSLNISPTHCFDY